MGNRYVSRETVGYGGRVRNAFGGIVVGIVFVVGSLALLWWNEGRMVETSRALAEGAKAVVEVDAGDLAAAKDGSLVHVGGRVASPEPLTDAELGVTTQGLALSRKVEMFQWKESETTTEEKKVGGSVERVTTYDYDSVWDDAAIDSSGFRHRDGHENPGDWPFRSETFRTSRATLGAYALSPDVISRFDEFAALAVPDDAQAPADFRVERGQFVRGSLDRPAIGDMRVSFAQVPEADYSVVALKNGNALAAFQASNGREILLVEAGRVPAKQMFENAESVNVMLGWLARGAGTLMIWIGLSLMLKPLSVMLDVIPFLGNLADRAIGVVAAPLAFGMALTTVSLAWVWYRPVLGISLLAVSIALFVYVRRRGKAPVAVPPPMPAVAGAGAMPPPPPPG